MNSNNKTNAVTARTKALLVLKGDQGPTALITPVVATVCVDPEERALSFRGPVHFSPKSEHHIRTVVHPLAERILSALNIDVPRFQLSITNPAVASLQGIGAKISDYSADMAVFMALLAAGFKTSTRETLVFTGHIAAQDGAIGMVSSLPEKIQAVVEDPACGTLIYPDLGQDPSLRNLAPAAFQRMTTALAQTKHQITAHGVWDIADVIQLSFSEIQVIHASLIHNIYGRTVQNPTSDTPVSDVLHFFSDNLEKRFWQALSSQLIQGQSEETSTLISAFAEHHLQHQHYPAGMGKQLFQILAALPPGIRRSKIKFPLLSPGVCIQLGQYAEESAQGDLVPLMQACSGEGISLALEEGKLRDDPQDISEDSLLETLLAQINNDHITGQITQPIDNARAAFMLDKITVDSTDAFNETIAAFYLHLLRHTRSVIEPAELNSVGPKSIALLERTFATKGGFEAALAEARYAPHGGLRWILDLITEKYKREEKEEYINYIFKFNLGPLDWDAKVGLMKSLITRLGDQLPAAITSQPPEKFVEKLDEIVRAYIQSMDQITILFR